MKKETSKSAIFISIVIAVFIICLVFIFQQEYELSKQLKAEVFQSINLGELIPEGQTNKIALMHCLEDAFDNYKNMWNQECENRGLEEKCSLPRSIADVLKENFEQVKQNCLDEYSVK